MKRRLVSVSILISVTSVAVGGRALGQSGPSRADYFGGWQKSAPTSPMGPDRSSSASGVERAAYFQGPNVPPGLSFPDAAAQAGGPTESMIQPAAWSGGAGDGSVFPPLSGSVPGSVYPPSSINNNLSNQFANPGAGPLPTTNVGGNSTIRPIARPAQVMPASMVDQSGLPSSSIRQRTDAAGSVPYGYPNAASNPQYAATQNSPAQIPVATGLPYVTRGSTGRAGTYPTSAYRGVTPLNQGTYFRNVSYQLPVTAPPTVATQPAPGTINTNNLAAQYQPIVGTNVTSYQPCSPYQPGIPTNGIVPGVVPGAMAPTTYPPNLAPALYSQDNSGYRPLFSLGQENYNVQLGRGIIGQPTVYVQGQPFRNFFRYISP
ncbi:MAG: hypothetical protein U0892_05785 [Pirellulales bacterium]